LNKRAVTHEELPNHRLDYEYYARKQLWNPIQRIMDLIVKRTVFKRHAVTAPIKANSGGITNYVKVGERRKKRRVDNPQQAPQKRRLDQKILSFFG